MAKIKNTDVSEKDVFRDLKKSAETSIKVLAGMEAIIKSNLELQKQFAKPLQAGNVNDLKALSNAQREVEKNLKSLNTIEKEKATLEVKLKQLNSDKIQQNEVLKVQISEQRRINKELAKDTLGLTNAYTRLTKQTNKAQAEFKRLAAEFGVNSKQAKGAKVEFDKLDDKLRKVNDAARDGRRDVGRYGTAFSKLGGVLRGGLGILGISSAIGVLGSVFKGAFDIVTGFGQAIADLGALTGTSGKELEAFKNGVLDVSKNTGKSATEIANAFKIVGSAQPELLKSASALAAVTESAVLLSKAGSIDIPAAADVLTKSLNQYGKSAKDATSFSNILASSQQKGTATIEQLGESFKNVGSVARASGLDFEQTNVVLQALAKGGLVGAEAGTKLRTILLRLAKTGREDLNPATQKFSDILNVLQGEVTNVTDAQALFGEEAAAAALTLINQKQVVTDLTGALNVNNAALDQANQRFNTVDGVIEKMKATWERLVLSVESGDGVISKALIGATNQLTAFFETLANLNSKQNFTKIGADIHKMMTGVELGVKSVDEVVKSVTDKFKELSYEQLKGAEIGSKITATYIKLGFTGIEAAAKLKELREQSKEANVAISDGTVVIENNTKATDKNNKSKKEQIKLDKYIVDKSFEGQDALDKENEAKLKAYEDEQKALEKLRMAQSEYERELEKQNDDDREALALKFEEEQAQKKIDLRDKTLSIIEALEKSYFDRKQKAADKEISDQAKREQQLQDLANQGVQDAKDSLAKNQKDQAEAEKKKEELIQQEKQFQLALAVYKAFNAELDKGASTGEALSKALVSTSVLTAAASSLPAFFDGTENTGSGGNGVDGKGGFHAILHPNERVVPKVINDKLDGLSNKDLGIAADSGLLAYALNSNQMGVHYDSNSTIKKELNKLYDSNQQIVKAINDKEVDKGWELDDLKKVVSHTVRKGSSITKTNFKL